MPTNQLKILYRQNAPKIFTSSIMILKWEYLLMVLLLNIFENAGIETGSFTKIFYLKKSLVHKE